jgi:putative heme-binding domain-containing protein
MIWVVDMYRAVIEHPEWIPQAWQQQIDLRAGSDKGRIYRIVPKDAASQTRLPNLSKQFANELIALLESGNGTLRDMVQQELLQRGDKSISNELRNVAASGTSPQARVQALWTLEGLGELQDDQLLEALGDEHPGVVRNAILLAEPRITESDAILKALAELAHHPDPKVIMQLALTLGESTAPVAGEALGRLVTHADNDPWLAQAIISSCKHHSLEVLTQLLAHLRRKDQKPDVQNRQAATIADLIATARAAGANPSALVADAIAHADEDATWVFPLAAACAEDTAGRSKLDQASRKSIMTVYQRAKSLAIDPAASSAARCQAIQLFGRSWGSAEQERSLLGELLSATTSLDVQMAAVERLAAFGDRESAGRLLARWSEMSFSVREAAALQLISNAASTDVLIAGLESGTLLPSDLSPAVRQTLRQSASQSLQSRINRVLGKSTAANQDLIQQYLQFQEENAGTADLSRGRELFQKHCAVCHVPDATGRAPGPELSNLTDRSRSALTESILVPNRAVEPQYRSYVVIMADGRALSGTVSEEAGATVTLALADGRRETIKRTEIDEFRNTGVSLMPEGFHQELDHGMLRDLIEYMRSDSFVQSVDHREI